MSDLTSLIVIYLVGMTGFLILYHIYNLTNQLGERMVAGTTIPTWFRTRMLFQMWLPYQAGAFAVEVVHVIVFLEAVDHVSSEGVKTLAYLFAFIAAAGALLTLMTMTLGLSQYRNRLLRSERA
jgi:hypothetical protein